MVRRRIEIKPIEESSKRHTTFTKRRQGLIKKTREFCNKFDAVATVIAFSKAGNVYAFGHPSVDDVVKRYLISGVAEESVRGDGDLVIKEKSHSPSTQLPMEAQKRISQTIGKGRPAWDVAMENLGLKELDDLAAAVESIKSEVAARKRKVESMGKSTLDGGFCTGG